jgi:hypothetical protein
MKDEVAMPRAREENSFTLKKTMRDQSQIFHLPKDKGLGEKKFTVIFGETEEDTTYSCKYQSYYEILHLKVCYLYFHREH